MKRAVIYARYSCDKQHETSIEGQLDVCYSYANKNGYEIIHEYIDRATSGRTDQREQFQQMLFDSYKKGFDAVIVYKLDRFSRNRYESVINEKHLNDNGVLLLSAMENINDQAESIILKSLMEGMNEYYSAELSQKVDRTFKIKRQNGEWLGGKIPYGFKIEGKKYVIDEEQAEKVRILFEKVADGVPPAKAGKQLDIPVSAHYICNNKKYIGILEHKGEELKDVIPRIIEDSLFYSAQDQLKHYEYHAHFKYALSGKMFCGTCGTAYKGESCTNRHGVKYTYYKSKCKCDHSRIRCSELEFKIVEEIKKVLDKDSIQRIADATINLLKEETDKHSVRKLEDALKSNKKRQTAIVNTIMESGASKLLGDKLIELEQEQRQLENQISAHKDIGISRKDIIEYLSKYLDSKEFNDSILNEFVSRVDVYPDYYEITCGHYRNTNGSCSTTTPKGVPLLVANELLIFPNYFKIRIAC